jgi:Zn-dependent M32 family carboxypeptidase
MNENTQPDIQAENGAAMNDAAASAAAAAGAQTERTFTQAELNAAVAERLQRERAKYADYGSIKQELAELKAANTVRDIREQVAENKKVPAKLLTGDTKEACEAQADAILAFAQGQHSPPAVPDGGEARSTGASTRDQFAEYLQAVLG